MELRRPSQLQVIQMVGYSSSRSVCKQIGTQEASIFQPGSFRQGSIWGRCLKERLPKGLVNAFPAPNFIQLVLSRLIRWGGDLIMITPFWTDQSWFLEIMHLVTEPPWNYLPSQCLLHNATTREAPQQVMKIIQLTTWRVTLPCVPGMASEKKLPGQWLTPGQREPSRTTTGCLNSGVLSAIRRATSPWNLFKWFSSLVHVNLLSFKMTKKKCKEMPDFRTKYRGQYAN